MGTILKLHHNHPSKSYSFVFRAAFISPQSGKAKSQYVDCTVWQVNKEKRNSLSKNLIHMLSGSVAGEVICASCLRLAESGRRATPVLLLACFVSCASPLLVVCVGWLPVHLGPSQLAQTAMCQFYYSYCCFAQWKKAALFLLLALILLPIKFVSAFHRLPFLFSVIFTLSLPPCVSVFDSFTSFFWVSSFISFTQPLSVSVSASVSCFEWGLIVTGALV